ncbi:hypothetical protein [Microbacterium sp. G2-8]|uniref:hypothetical protein n=1 Tax=Microbacterium sp. G2-8 TaxID=2842454 RepID=UPI001C893C71|nr:hypothetical protein [Microbacterium sp. G2-8]
MIAIDIVPVALPETVDAPDARDFVDYVAVTNAAMREQTGSAALRQRPEDVLASMRETDHAMWSAFLARIDGDAVGAAQLVAPFGEGSHASMGVFVTRRISGGRIETMLIKEVERAARDLMRSRIRAVSLHRADPGGPTIASEDDAGSVPRDPQSRSLSDAGYALGQVMRYSSCDPQDRRIDEHLTRARSRTTHDYEIVWWVGSAPEDMVDDYADVLGHATADEWDIARVRAREARFRERDGVLGVAGARHLRTGRLVAVSELFIGQDRSATTATKNTLVVPEHRGHRLGLLTKCTALTAWRDVAPASTEIVTANPEDDAHLLAINEAVGFEPIYSSGEWHKIIAV